MTEIPRRTLGRTGLEVSTLGYGAMELRGAPTGPDLSDADAATLLNELLDAGVNFIDTSIDYGRSEPTGATSTCWRRSAAAFPAHRRVRITFTRRRTSATVSKRAFAA